MSWRGKLNQQAVTSGKKYSPETLSTLRRRDLQSQYDEASSGTADYSDSQSVYKNEGFKSSGNASRSGTNFQESYEDSPPVIGNRMSSNQPGGGQGESPGSSPQAVNNFASSLRESARLYREARDKAESERETQNYIKMGTGTVLGAITGGPAGAMMGLGSALLGQAIPTVFGDDNFDQRMEQQDYRRGISLYDAMNGNEDNLLNWHSAPVSKQDFIKGTISDLYNSSGLTDDKRADLLRRLGLEGSRFGEELGYDVPDISSPEFSDWAKGQAVPGWNFSEYAYQIGGV